MQLEGLFVYFFFFALALNVNNGNVRISETETVQKFPEIKRALNSDKAVLVVGRGDINDTNRPKIGQCH